MVDLPRDASGKRPVFFEQDGVDQLVSMVLELATELWVVKERLYAVEAVADERGLNLRSGVEGWVANEAQATELAAMRARMLSDLFRTLNREPSSRSTPSLVPEPPSAD
jgi:hypothetical protein